MDIVSVQNRSRHNGNNGNTTGGNFCSYCCKPAHVKLNCFKLKKKETRYDHNQNGNNNNGNHDREKYDLQDVVFVAFFKNEFSQKISGFLTVELMDIIATFLRASSMLKYLREHHSW
jgi:hypothetical protein